MFNKKIIIIGGGLVGSLCACFLARRGFEIEIYEYREDVRKSKQVSGRSINLALSHRGRLALRAIDLEEQVLEDSIPMRGRLLHSISNDTKCVLYDDQTNQCIYSIGRTYLNKILLTEAEKYPNVKINFQCKLLDVDFDSRSCTIFDTINNVSSKKIADLIIGADGAFSRVRRCMQQFPLFQYSQTFIEHGYMELSIPSNKGHLMDQNYLHIWPRGEFMMISLPNKDNSWTVTLFMSLMKFRSIDTKYKLEEFFESTFPDVLDLIEIQHLEEQFFSTSPSHLVSIKCAPYHLKGNALIIGDAAHAMVPFYGQGMNCGFEDCTLLDELFADYGNDFPTVLEQFTHRRRDDAHAICDLAMYNYIEMRELVTRKSFLCRKLLDGYLSKIFPNSWIPLYNSVSFSSMRYKECVDNRKWQNKVLVLAVCSAILLILFLVIVSIRK